MVRKVWGGLDPYIGHTHSVCGHQQLLPLKCHFCSFIIKKDIDQISKFYSSVAGGIFRKCLETGEMTKSMENIDFFKGFG